MMEPPAVRAEERRGGGGGLEGPGEEEDRRQAWPLGELGGTQVARPLYKRVPRAAREVATAGTGQAGHRRQHNPDGWQPRARMGLTPPLRCTPHPQLQGYDYGARAGSNTSAAKPKPEVM